MSSEARNMRSVAVVHHVTVRGGLALIAACGAATPCFAQNQPPSTPTITEPQVARIVNPSDVHMETAPFSDPNPGDTHLCTDWEIVRADTNERVWVTSCIGGVERVHTHLGDGDFQGSLEGRRTLDAETSYRLRVRHRDNSGVLATEWSAWAERTFVTGSLSRVFPLQIQDVLNVPAPTFSAILPSGGTPAVARLEDISGQLLLEVRGAASSNTYTNPAPLGEHGAARLVVTAGSAALDLPESELAVTTDDGSRTTLYVPAIALNAGQSQVLWIARNGSTYYGNAGQTAPDFSQLARGAAVPWTTASDVRVEVVATGFQLPVNIVFVPNPGTAPNSPLYYVTELYGTIKVVRRDGTVSDYATGLLNFNPTGNFPGSGEQGLSGLAVDPTNGDIYAAMLYSSNPNDDNAPHYPKVVRFTSNDGGLTAATQTIILNMAPEQQGQSHQISNVTFGPDGFLYVHCGDGFDAGAARNLNFFRGKILRMTRAGAAVASNPYYNAGNGITATDYIYASGVRNPFGGAWRLSDESHYFVENGPSVDRFAKLVRGRDYLYDGSDASMQNFALYNWAPSTAPVNIAFLESSIFGGSGFPAEYSGRAYVTQSGGTFGVGPGDDRNKVVTEWVIDGTGALVSGPRPVAIYNGSGASSAVAIATGPDGLYFSDFYKEDSTDNPVARGSNILRIRYQPPAPPPDCNSNGIPDADDIAAGTSRDCNGNGIPDECDIATGRSQDCNVNGVPDECDSSVAVTETFDAGRGVWTLNGNARLTAGRVRLTVAESDRIGTVIRPPLTPTPMTSFDASFDFRIGNGSGADGFSFAAFDAARYTINELFGEEGPGSQTNTPGGPGTLVVQFDTYDNGGEGENTIEIACNGATLGRYTPTFDLENGQLHRATVTFRNNAIRVTVTNNEGVAETAFDNLAVPYTPYVALMGFGGRTGGLNNEHDIDNVTFRVPGPNDRNGNGVPDECDCPPDFNGDGFLDFFDYDAFVECFIGEGCPGTRTADINRDGFVDFFDYDDFVQMFETGC